VLEKHLLFWARFWVPEQALQKNSISSTGANRRGIFLPFYLTQESEIKWNSPKIHILFKFSLTTQ